MATGDSKTCTKCGTTKPLDAFYKRRDSPDGLTTACKDCRRTDIAAYQRANRGKVNAWQRANRDPAKARERQRQWRHGAGREKFLAKQKRYRERNSDKIKQDWAEWYAANGNDRLARKRALYDPEKKRAERSPERTRIDRDRRRARMLAAYVEDTPFDEVLVRDLGICGICSSPIMSDKIDLDHIVPLAAGGTHEMKNVQLAHPTCNKRKGTRANFTLPVTAL